MPSPRSRSPRPARAPRSVRRVAHGPDPLLLALGERLRTLRARRGLTRRMLAAEAQVSERHLANLESGRGNASILVLAHIATALGSSLAELVGDETTASPEWLLIRQLLGGRPAPELERARAALAALFADGAPAADRARRVALVGLRGAGKSTLGRMLADELGVPFVELRHEIERLAGCPQAEIHSLYGATAYRRYERRALEAVLAGNDRFVLATPGGLVSESATLGVLLASCTTIWLRASPEEHLRRVVAQGDLRPMAESREALADLKTILAGRERFYAKADATCNTSGRSLAACLAELRTLVEGARRDLGAAGGTKGRRSRVHYRA